MASPLVETKLYTPRLRRGLVARPRLSVRLSRAAESRLTLISAPAGFGKTTLLAEPAANRTERSVAWLSLEESDSQPTSYWTYLITALQAPAPAGGARRRHQRAPAPAVGGDRDRPDIPVGAVARRLAGRQGLQALPHHHWRHRLTANRAGPTLGPGPAPSPRFGSVLGATIGTPERISHEGIHL